MIKKPVSFHTGLELKLVGDLYFPAPAAASPLPGVVLCPGPGGGHQQLLPDVATWLIKRGYAVLVFDHRGFGDSEGPRHRLIPREQVEDIRCAITFMQEQAGVDPARIALWGGATGGANAVYTAALDARVKALAAVSAAGDCGRWVRSLRPYWQWAAFLEEIETDRRERVQTGKSRLIENGQLIVRDPATVQFRKQLDAGTPSPRGMMSLESAEAIIEYRPEEVVSRISPRAALWIVAALDTLVPNEESERMYRLAGEPRQLSVIEGELHHTLYSGAGFEKMMRVSAAWFDRWLK
jgi:alpha-beta hydrolase superfamily lysophospholipase